MNPPLTNMGPAWPSMPHLKPVTSRTHDRSCSYIQREGDCDCVAQIPHNVEPPIERAAHLQAQLRRLRQDRDEYKRLLLVTEQLIADYEVLAGVPF